MNTEVRIFSQRSPNRSLCEKDCSATEQRSRGGEGDIITKGRTEVGEQESGQDPSTGVRLPGNQPQLPVALVAVNGGVWATNYP